MTRKDSKGRNLRTGESQRKDGCYQYRYKDLDGERKTVYGWRLVRSDKTPPGKKDDIPLREKENEIQKNLLKMKNNRGLYLTLNDMFDDYLVRKRHKGKPLSDKTKTNYKGMWNKHIRDSMLGNQKLLDIKKVDIIKRYQQLQNDGLSYGTILFFQRMISSVFNMAIDDGILEKNPTLRALDEIEGETEKREALTIAQQTEVLLYAKKHNPGMYQKLIICFDTMCRFGEFAGLTWKDIDMKKRYITINHQLQYIKLEGDEKAVYHILPTKSRKSRTIPMTDEVYRILKEMKKYYFVSNKGDMVDGKENFLFYTDRGKLYYESVFSAELNRFVKDYDKTAQNKIGHLIPHVLRHTGCTRNAENGMDMKVLQYLMGHSSSKITNDVYNHVNEERAKEELLKARNKPKKRA